MPNCIKQGKNQKKQHPVKDAVAEEHLVSGWTVIAVHAVFLTARWTHKKAFTDCFAIYDTDHAKKDHDDARNLNYAHTVKFKKYWKEH